MASLGATNWGPELRLNLTFRILACIYHDLLYPLNSGVLASCSSPSPPGDRCGGTVEQKEMIPVPFLSIVDGAQRTVVFGTPSEYLVCWLAEEQAEIPYQLE